MPLRNRVTPLGDIVAAPGRGTVFGNRGRLHDAQGRIRRPYDGRRWIACRLEFRGRRRWPLLQPGRYTELFFLDEATAFAAGHRPCAECRHDDYRHFLVAWHALHPEDGGADAVDRRLHGERLDARSGGRRYHEAVLGGLPDGTFVLHEGAPWLVLGARLLEWSADGYAARARRPRGERVVVVTPPSLVSILRGGWLPAERLLHPSALESAPHS